jgi:hypothetical protein
MREERRTARTLAALCKPLLLLLLLLLVVRSAQAQAASLHAVVGDVGAYAFSASVRAQAAGQVAYVVWLASDTAAYRAPLAADVWGGLAPDGTALDASRAGVLALVRAQRRARWRATQLSMRVCAAPAGRVAVGHAARRARAGVRNAVHTVAVRQLQRGGGGRHGAHAGRDAAGVHGGHAARVCSWRVRRRVRSRAQRAGRCLLPPAAHGRKPALSRGRAAQRKARLRCRRVHASPDAADVRLLARHSGLLSLPVAGAELMAYILNGVAEDTTYVLYLACVDFALPTANVKQRLEALVFSTPLCDACAANTRRLPLAADCACAEGLPYELQIGVAAGAFEQELFARALAARLALLPPQVLVLNISAVGDATRVQLELLPMALPMLGLDAVMNATGTLVASGADVWAQAFGGITVRCVACIAHVH